MTNTNEEVRSWMSDCLFGRNSLTETVCLVIDWFGCFFVLLIDWLFVITVI